MNSISECKKIHQAFEKNR